MKVGKSPKTQQPRPQFLLEFAWGLILLQLGSKTKGSSLEGITKERK